MLLLRRRHGPTTPASRPGRDSPRIVLPTPSRTWAEMAWLLIGVYWIVLGVFVLPVRLHSFRFGDTVLFGLVPLLRGLVFRLFGPGVPSRTPPRPLDAPGRRRPAGHLAGRLALSDRRGDDDAVKSRRPRTASATCSPPTLRRSATVPPSSPIAGAAANSRARSSYDSTLHGQRRHVRLLGRRQRQSVLPGRVALRALRRRHDAVSHDGSYNWTGETGWSSGGGGVSRYEPNPAYQSGLSYARRANPDVAYDADPNTGFAVYDSYGGYAWASLGGTSAGAPQWSAIIALANQGRVAAGKIGSRRVHPDLPGHLRDDHRHDRHAAALRRHLGQKPRRLGRRRVTTSSPAAAPRAGPISSIAALVNR